MAHKYSSDEHFDSFTKRTHRDSDAKVLARLKATYGPNGDMVDGQRDTSAPPPVAGKSQHADGAGDNVPDAMEPESAEEESAPHPEGCMCEACKMDRKQGGKMHGGKHPALSHEDAEALMR